MQLQPSDKFCCSCGNADLTVAWFSHDIIDGIKFYHRISAYGKKIVNVREWIQH